jgi:3-deoxy-manno-octulosonate cytidylyltransferase (CMP-KDO synthetase)
LKVAIIIPARLGSSRFPRKVLARETGKYLIEHVFERVVATPGIDRVIVATDSEEVLAAGRSFGAETVLTRADHLSGTDRVAEVARRLPHDVIINVQGDEPLIEREDLAVLRGFFEGDGGASCEMATLAARREDPEGFQDPNIVKVVIGAGGNALYFSRAPVPHARGGEAPLEWHQHIGIYAYRRDTLLRLSALPATALEKRERLEQLRALENGCAIRVGLTAHPHLGIDTEEEYRRFVAAEARARGTRGGGGAARLALAASS